MKKYFLIGVLFFPQFFLAQVGVNTLHANATFDVIAINKTGNTSKVDGLLLPRVSRERAKSMTDVPISTIIYVDDVVSGTQSGIAVNINTETFYYFDGTVWQKLVTPSAENKIFAVASKNAVQTLTGGGKDITWQNLTGTNSGSVSISGGNLVLPANKTFLLQGYIAWVSSSTIPLAVAWMKYNFVNTSNVAVGSLNISGYLEASTENVNDGGSNPATTLITTDASPLTIKLRTVGTGAGGNFDLSYGNGNTGTCYVLIQEL
jgi:hypothetical protein